MKPVEQATDFQSVQRHFARHLRHPELHEPPGNVEPRRLKIYQQLFYNNIQNFIANGFPVLRSLYEDEPWHRMVRDFFHRHQCRSPYFLKIGEEFLHYLQQEREPQPEDPPFALELAHYEYMEVVLDTADEEIPESGYHPAGDLLAGVPFLSPLVCILNYHWPVHLIGPEMQPQEPLKTPVSLVIYRNRQDEVGFMELNPLMARLLLRIDEEDSVAGQQHVEALYRELSAAPNSSLPSRADFFAQASEALNSLRQKDILLGVRLEPQPTELV